MTFGCGCKGTVHDRDCYAWPSRLPPPVVYEVEPEDKILRKLERIIVLLEEIAGRRR